MSSLKHAESRLRPRVLANHKDFSTDVFDSRNLRRCCQSLTAVMFPQCSQTSVAPRFCQDTGEDENFVFSDFQGLHRQFVTFLVSPSPVFEVLCKDFHTWLEE